MTSNAPKVRVGILLNDLKVPAWQEVLLRRLLASDDAEIVALIVRDQPPAPPRTFWKKLTQDVGTIVYRLYARLDAAFFQGKNDAFVYRDISDIAAAIPTLRVQPIETKHCDRFEEKDLAMIQELKPDVLLRFGFRILRGGILTAAPGGVWSYHHGDPATHRGTPPGFWEVMEQVPVTGSMLQILSEDLDNGRILYRSWSATDKYSVHRSKNTVYWKSVEFVPRCLRMLREMGTEAFLSTVVQRTDPFYTGRMYVAPQNAEALRVIVPHVFRAVWLRVMEILRPRQWIIRYGKTRVNEDSPSWSLWRFADLEPPTGSFWADPCLVVHEGKSFIFFEEYKSSDERGRISVCEVGGEKKEAIPVIAENYHLSHPEVFQWNGSYYMIPESAEHRTVDLYRCTEFPFHWEKIQTLFNDVDGVDATMFERDGKWWMFMNIRPHPAASSWDELHLYSAETPMGPWIPHKQNPIVSDVRCARPAGRVFTVDDALYRPAQDCSGGYGSAVRVQRITELSTETYTEEPAWHLEPERSQGFIAMHTLSVMDQWAAIDEQRRIGLNPFFMLK